MIQRPTIALLVTSALLAGAAIAQTEGDEGFRAIEEGFEDVSPLAESHRLQMIDLRANQGFARVYELTEFPGLLARRDGAVTAVFGRSVYEADSTALIPPGTVFYIGRLPVDLAGPGLLADARLSGDRRELTGFVDQGVSLRSGGTQLAQRVDLRAVAEGDRTSEPGALTHRGICTSEEYRQRRVGDLLRGIAWQVREMEAGPLDGPADDGAEIPPPPAPGSRY